MDLERAAWLSLVDLEENIPQLTSVQSSIESALILIMRCMLLYVLLPLVVQFARIGGEVQSARLSAGGCNCYLGNAQIEVAPT